MTNPLDKASEIAALRKRAEEQLAARAVGRELPSVEDDLLKLVHELQVHQIELEMQNEELRRSREEAEAARDMYSLLYEFAPIGYFTLTRDGMVLTANLTGATLLGVDRSRLINQDFARFVAYNDRKFFADLLVKVVMSRERQTCALTLTKSDRRPLVVQVAAVAAESVEGFLVAITDISERKRLEDALIQTNQELEQRVAGRTEELARSVSQQKEEMAGRLKAVEDLREKELLLIQQSRMAAMGEMIGNIAHQWRQPLNTLGLLVQQALLFYDAGDVTQEFMEENTKKQMEVIHHMSRTIDDFKDFFRPDKDKITFNVREVVAKTLLLMEGTFKSQHIEVDIDAQSDPAIYGYPNEFCQVLLNILANAKDAVTERKIVNPKIMIGIGSAEHKAVITIVDNAGGIPVEILDKVFDPYFTTKGPNAGTGVGLFMSKTIVRENMGGQLLARNLENGAEFRIEVWDGSERRSNPRISV